MLPVEMVAVTPSPICCAIQMQVRDPRSLKLQVGFWVSFLSSSLRTPVDATRAGGAGKSGVLPSPREEAGSGDVKGRKSAKRSQRYRPGPIVPVCASGQTTSSDSPSGANSPGLEKENRVPVRVEINSGKAAVIDARLP